MHAGDEGVCGVAGDGNEVGGVEFELTAGGIKFTGRVDAVADEVGGTVGNLRVHLDDELDVVLVTSGRGVAYDLVGEVDGRCRPDTADDTDLARLRARRSVEFERITGIDEVEVDKWITALTEGIDGQRVAGFAGEDQRRAPCPQVGAGLRQTLDAGLAENGDVVGRQIDCRIGVTLGPALKTRRQGGAQRRIGAEHAQTEAAGSKTFEVRTHGGKEIDKRCRRR